MGSYQLRSLSRKDALRLADYALVSPKPRSLKVVKPASKKFFGVYQIKAQKMKRDSKGSTLKGTLFVKFLRKG